MDSGIKQLASGRNDKFYVIAFLAVAGVLIFAGRDLVQGAAIVTWGVTFGGTTAVAVLAAALYRVRLELQASRRQLARKEAEVSFAREVQSALFPRELPRACGLEFTAVCIPASGISGDYYDVLELANGRVIFAVADISGKGISAAILMANLQAVLRTLAEGDASPREICMRLDRHLHRVTDDSRFATFFLAEWQESNRVLRYVNAGHNPPLLLGAHDATRLVTGGPPIGLLPDSTFEMGEVLLQQGEMLVIYSDGITEAESANGEQFGERRLQQIVEENFSKPLVEIQ
ncbi:MAG TPA: PP2C family protein-serine/threonine phosphatase, partial [Blastocatellia bacterium]|nr:PP2C family protein-serine/threonine phosphatase [Blastocatellia bacterium]